MPGKAEAKAAYDRSIEALKKALATQKSILTSQNPDWDAYDAAADAALKARSATDAAGNVYAATLLDIPAVQQLLQALSAETAEIQTKVASLKKTAHALNALAMTLDAATTTLKALLKFV